MSGYTNGKAACPPGKVAIDDKARAQTFPCERKPTQEEQNKVDDENRRHAMKELVSSWLERLQLISVITTFFASAEAVLLGITTREPETQDTIDQATNAAFLSALVLHTSAAIVSFLGAFFIINYKVNEARKQEIKAEGGVVVETRADIEKAQVDSSIFKTDPVPGAIPTNLEIYPPVFSTNPHLVQVGPFQGKPPTNILKRCHSLSVFFATVGFALAMVGIGCFSWARHARSASIFSTATIGISLTLMVGILVIPDVAVEGASL